MDNRRRLGGPHRGDRRPAAVHTHSPDDEFLQTWKSLPENRRDTPDSPASGEGSGRGPTENRFLDQDDTQLRSDAPAHRYRSHLCREIKTVIRRNYSTGRPRSTSMVSPS